ncbi:hypothetical protein CFAEC_14380 (plasmid) [Corynebacterium faecale]|nr:hypothetical protein CFAEC_14380 [Corynebacterium faecale]
MGLWFYSTRKPVNPYQESEGQGGKGIFTCIDVSFNQVG